MLIPIPNFRFILSCALAAAVLLTPFVSPLQAAPKTKILFLGDSLCAGYGVEQEQAFPSLINTVYQNQPNLDVRVINASISGSTSASGYSRLRWGLRNKPDILVLELGANDGLRGLSTEDLEKNLAKTIRLALKNNIKVLLAGMQVPPNYGKNYSSQFKQVFSRLAVQHNITLIPFLLEGVAGDPGLNTADGIHPNARGHQIIAQTVMKYLTPLLKQ